jgi:hypothetical protein
MAKKKKLGAKKRMVKDLGARKAKSVRGGLSSTGPRAVKLK